MLLMKFLANGDAAYITGIGCGVLFWVGLLGFFLVRVAKRCKDPQANPRCLIGLACVLTALIVATIGGNVLKPMGAGPVVAVILFLIVFLGMLAGIVLGIVGMVEVCTNRQRWRRGVTHAVWTFVLSGLFLAGVGLVIGDRIAQRSSGTDRIEFGPSIEQTIDEMNFRYRPIGTGWRSFDATAVNPAAKVAFVNPQTRQMFFIIPEALGIENDLSQSQYTAAVESLLSTASTRLNIETREQVTLAGIEGTQLEGVMYLGTEAIAFVHWAGMHNGYAYQLALRDRSGKTQSLKDKAASVFSGFSLLDRDSVFRIAGTHAQPDYDSNYYGLHLSLEAHGWVVWPEWSSNQPAALIGTCRSDQRTVFIVIGVDLQSLKPDLQSVTDGFFDTIGVKQRSMRILEQHDIRVGNLSGVEYVFDDSYEGVAYRNIARILLGDNRAYLLTGWTEQATADRIEIVRTTINNAVFRPPNTTAQPPEDDLLRQADTYNYIGLSYYRNSQYDQSAKWFKLANDANPNNAQFLLNRIEALSNLERYGDALSLLNQQLPDFADNHELRASQAFILANHNQVEKAVQLLADLFDSGYRDASDFTSYIGLVDDIFGPKEAVRRIDRFSNGNPSPHLAIDKAYLLGRIGRADDAIGLLRKLRQSHPRDADLGYALADILNDADRNHEALAVLEALVDDGYDSSDILHLRGVVEYHMRQYRQAKLSFEAALAKAPDSETTRSFLVHVSAMLGDGANTNIKTPIDPVPLPDGLWEGAPTTVANMDQAQSTGYYERRAVSIAFKPQQYYRTTEYRTIQITSPESAARFNELQFSFDPLSESLFVNCLDVYDASGTLIESGKVDDYYVIDDNRESIRSHDKTLHIPVPALKPGCRVQLVVTRQETVVGDAPPYECRYLLNLTPTLRYALVYQGPRDRLKHIANFVTNTEIDGALVWSTDQASTYRWEARQDVLASFAPHVVWSDPQSSWEQIGKEYLQTIDDRLEPPGSIKGLARGLIEDQTDTAAKINRIVGFVREGLTYTAIEFGRRARVMNPTDMTIRNKYGDCKDHALLLKQMLESVGIEAHLALVHTNEPLRQDLPSLDQFNHMIVWVPDIDGGRAIDTTDKEINPSIDVPLGLGGQTMLVLDPKSPRLIELPQHNHRSNSVDIDRRVRIDQGREDIHVTEALEFKGYYASWMRNWFRGVEQKERRHQVRSLLSRSGTQVELHSLEIQGLDDRTRPMNVRMTYTFKGVFHSVGDKLVGRMPAPFEYDQLKTEFVESRQSPFRILYPMQLQARVELELPDDMTIADGLTTDENQRNNDFVNWSITPLHERTTVVLPSHIVTKAGRFPATRYDEYHKTMQELVLALQPKITLGIKSPE